MRASVTNSYVGEPKIFSSSAGSGDLRFAAERHALERQPNRDGVGKRVLRPSAALRGADE